MDDTPDAGSLLLNFSPLSVGATFSQQDVAEGRLSYQHDGSNVTDDEFSLSVADGGENDSRPLDALFRVNIGDPIAILPLDDGAGVIATDISGFGNDGTLQGGAIFEAASPDGSPFSVSLDGTDDYINLAPLDISGARFTLATWFNADSFPGSAADPRLIAKDSGSAANDHIFMLGTILSQSAVRLRARVRIGGVTTTLVADTGDLFTNEWYHAAMTHDGNMLRLYLDGIEVGSTALVGQVDSDPTINVAVGSQSNGVSRHFDGLIDDVRILNRVLGPVELQLLAAEVVPSPIPTEPANFSGVPISGNQVELVWSASSDDIGVTGYDVYRDGVLIGTTSDNRWSDSGVVPGQTYDYEVIANDADGNFSTGATFSVTTVDPVDGAWWDSRWAYRVLVGVGSGEISRSDRITEYDIDFTQLFASLGEGGAFAPSILRCHEVSAAGVINVADIPCQFEPDPGYDAQTSATGKLVLLMSGSMPAESARYYHIYFDAVGGAGVPAPPIAPLVDVIDNVADEGQFSYQVATEAGQYFYQKDAGGFSSIVDIDGNDWIDYHPTGGSAGSFRGIPNLVYPEGHFHPGATTAISTLTHSGPLKATIHSITVDGLWEVVWEIYPRRATMTLLTSNAPYWFLYEGTPGGALEPASDFSVRSDGTITAASTSWGGDLTTDEWVYFADPGVGRSLYLAHHEDDAAHDSYVPLDGLMTVFGFGREGLVSSLQQQPAHFTIGLVDSVAFNMLSPVIEGVVVPVVVGSSGAVSRP